MPRRDPTLHALVHPGPAADLIRTDNRTWRTTVLEAIDSLLSPSSHPLAVKRHIDELLGLADRCDEIIRELRSCH